MQLHTSQLQLLALVTFLEQQISQVPYARYTQKNDLEEPPHQFPRQLEHRVLWRVKNSILLTGPDWKSIGLIPPVLDHLN